MQAAGIQASPKLQRGCTPCTTWGLLKEWGIEKQMQHEITSANSPGTRGF